MKPSGQNQTSVEILVEAIKNSIHHGTYKPGDKLPTLQQMEQIYGVSRIAIREAVKVLEGQGVLFSKRGSGIYVRDLDGAKKGTSAEGYSQEEIFSLFEFIYHCVVFELKDLEDLSEIREWRDFNQELIDSWPRLTFPRKLAYESMFGARLVKLSKNRLIMDLFLKIMQPANSMDHLLVSQMEDYLEILKLDREFIQALLDRDPHRACFLGHERNRIFLKLRKHLSP